MTAMINTALLSTSGRQNNYSPHYEKLRQPFKKSTALKFGTLDQYGGLYAPPPPL